MFCVDIIWLKFKIYVRSSAIHCNDSEGFSTVYWLVPLMLYSTLGILKGIIKYGNI